MLVHYGDGEAVSLDDDLVEVPESSILGQVVADIGEQVDGTTTVLAVGKTTYLACRYQAIDDDARADIRKDGRAAARLASKVGAEPVDAEREANARLLATACVELLYRTPKGDVSLGVALQGEGVDCPAVLRYNRDLVKALGGKVQAALGDTADMVDIVTHLHRNGESTSPLETAAALYEQWASGVTADAIAALLGSS